MTKYNFDITSEVLTKTLNRLTNQVWKLIPMAENNEDWKKQINTVILEIAGLNEIFSSNPYFLSSLSKLEGLLIKEYNFDLYRKTVFEIISILYKTFGEKIQIIFKIIEKEIKPNSNSIFK